MSKKQSLILTSVILFSLALLLWFILDALYFNALITEFRFTFMDVTFGKKMPELLTIFGAEKNIFNFSIINFVGFVSMVLLVLMSAAKLYGFKANKNLDIYSAVAFTLSVLSAVIVILVKTFIVIPNGADLKDFTTQVGVYLIPVLLILGGISALGAKVVKR